MNTRGNRPENEAATAHGRASEHPHPVEQTRTVEGPTPGAGADGVAQFSPQSNSGLNAEELRRCRNYVRETAHQLLSHPDRKVRDLACYASAQLGRFE